MTRKKGDLPGRYVPPHLRKAPHRPSEYVHVSDWQEMVAPIPSPVDSVVTVRRPGRRLAQESSLECARRHAHCTPERCDEVCRRCEADTVGDLGDGLPWLLQECDPAFKPA
jgi:hypothetical protein